MSAIEKTKKLIGQVLKYIEGSPWRNYYADRINILSERINLPCELAVVGRVKAGKSSFLNALLQDNLALVGTTETTATINFFKYGQPIDDIHPVKVVWADGREEWQTKAFLDSLQGNDKETLEKANDIDHLEYFVLNPILSNITLVDTPGTGALVNEHEQRTSDYLSGEYEALRKKHEQQSMALKSKADAVVVITERVPTSSTNDLIGRFSNDTSAFNTIGVMTKIDMEPDTSESDWIRRCEKYSQMLRDQLNTIVPVSAGVYHAVRCLNQNGKLKEIQEKIRLIPSDTFNELFDGDRIAFLTEGDEYDDLYSEYGLPYSERIKLVGSLEWEVFYIVARELYKHPIETAADNLIAYSGMEQIRSILERQFFNRSRIIRCAKITEELRLILSEIYNRHLYDLRFNAANRADFLRIINESISTIEVKNAFKNFVLSNIVSIEDYKSHEEQINNLIVNVENLLLEFKKVDNNVEALLLLDKHNKAFNEHEIIEIETILGKRGDVSDLKFAKDELIRKQSYWRGKRNMAFNKDVKHIIEIVLSIYETLPACHE